MRSLLAVITLISTLLGCAAALEQLPEIGKLQNLDLRQSVDLSLPYLKQSFQVTVVNTGAEPAWAYYVPIPEEDVPQLSALEARIADGDLLVVYPDVSQTVKGPDGKSYALYRIEFPESQPLLSGQTVKLTYGIATVRKLKPLPKAAPQKSTQMLVYSGSRNAISVYDTVKQETAIKVVTQNANDLGSGQSVESNKNIGALLTYGPFKNVAPLVSKPIELQYENPLSMTRFPKLDRKIWVSHWGGSISFDESYDLINDGTELSTPFSRLDFGKMQAGFSLNSAAIRHLRLQLASENSREEYFVDLVGNVSTSRVTSGVLDVYPRYPVMGGWRYNFTVGWANDLNEFVHSPSEGSYILRVPVLGGTETPASYDEVTTTIVLPEGASAVEVYDDFNSEVKTSVTYNYLDLFGRPTVTLKYQNLVDSHHGANILVSYRYSLLVALRKPVAYAVGIFALFMGTYYIAL